jgi:hypothetical protein
VALVAENLGRGVGRFRGLVADIRRHAGFGV